ncbi:MAG: glycosyltransferase [Muribaculaceae bacterium]|nr:glycosyltransferase [Muribaculaceae bacterium]
MNPPLISIVIPVYNVVEYVEACLESIRLQTYTNIEVIVVNDGSTDNSLQICKNYINKINDSRFKLYSKSNGGLGDTRNYGICKTNSDSEYVIFVDSDDELSTDAIESLRRYSTHDTLVIGKLYRCKESDRELLEGNIVGEKYNDIWNNLHFLKQLKNGIINSCCGKCYSLRKIRNNSLRFEKELPEDTRFNIEYLKDIDKICVLSRPVYYYFIRQNSMSTEPNEIIFKNYLKLQQELYERISESHHRYINQFVYPQYRGNAMKFIKRGNYQIPKKYLRMKLIRHSFSSYQPVSLGDFIVHICLRFGLYKLVEAL